MSPIRALVGWAVAVSLAAPPLPAQTAPVDAPADAPTERADVFFDSLDLTVVNVDVYVTDRDGRPVAGLTAEDFEVLEDGRPVAVTNFYAVHEGRPADGAGIPAPLATGAGPDEIAIEPLDGGEALASQRLRLVIYVDNLFLRPPNRNKVLRATRGFLRRMIAPGDQMMVVTFDRSLQVRQAFTTDKDRIEEALDDAEELTGYASQAATERRDVMRRIDNARSAFDAESHALSHAESRFFEVRQSIGALKEMIGTLAGLPGRKAVLYVSDGLPMTAGEELFYYIDQRFGDATSGQLQAARFRARRLIRELTTHANANRVTFYTIEAAGLRVSSSISAEHSYSGGSRIELDAVRDSGLEATLEMIARDTGGLATLNSNDLDGALARMGGDFRSYYSLGYVPAHGSRGGYHTLDVRTKRKGLRVRHRDGYRDKTAETRLSEGTLASLMHGVGHNPLGLDLVLEPPRREGDGTFLLPVAVRIPLGALTLIPREDRHVGRVTLALAAIDQDDALSPVSQNPLAIEIPDRDLPGALEQYYTYAALMRMKPGQHEIAVGLHDEIGSTASFLRRRVRIGQ